MRICGSHDLLHHERPLPSFVLSPTAPAHHAELLRRAGVPHRGSSAAALETPAQEPVSSRPSPCVLLLLCISSLTICSSLVRTLPNVRKNRKEREVPWFPEAEAQLLTYKLDTVVLRPGKDDNGELTETQEAA